MGTGGVDRARGWGPRYGLILTEGAKSGVSCTGRAAVVLLGLWGLVLPPAALGAQEGQDAPASPEAAPAPPVPAPPESAPPVPAPPVTTESAPTSGALDEGRDSIEFRLGTFIEDFDRFFGADRRQDIETPSSRFRLKLYERSGEDRAFAMGFALSASLRLPRLERWLGNARVVIIGEREPEGLPRPMAGESRASVEAGEPLPGMSDGAPPFLGRGRAQVELRFDLLRRRLVILDTGLGSSLVWPPVPFARVRAHLRHPLGGGVALRATEVLFVEFWGRGAGVGSDVEVARLLTPWMRLRWEGHGVFAQRTRGIEWSTLVGIDWRVHPRTGLFATAGCAGFGTPSASVDLLRVVTGVRQDVWHNWVFVGLEPEVYWPRPAGMARSQVLAVTARLEVKLDSQVVAPP